MIKYFIYDPNLLLIEEICTNEREKFELCIHIITHHK